MVCSIRPDPVQEADEETEVLDGFGSWEVEARCLRVSGLFEELETEDAAGGDAVADDL